MVTNAKHLKELYLLLSLNLKKLCERILVSRQSQSSGKTSLSAHDLPAAARHVETYLTLGDAVRQDSARAAAMSQIEQSIAELSRKVKEAADRILAQPDLTVSQAIDAVKLFVLIALKEEGLQRLTDHFKAIVKRESDSDIRAVLIDAAEGFGVDEPHIMVLERLFESVAAVLHDARTTVVHLFGARAVGEVIKALQETCDASANRIFERYKEKLRIEEVLLSIRSETANARDLDEMLNELTLLSQRMSAYYAFLEERAVVEGLPDDEAKELKDAVGKILANC